jgi:hypothetical protein
LGQNRDARPSRDPISRGTGRSSSAGVIADDAREKQPSIPLDALANDGNAEAFLAPMDCASERANVRRAG